MESQDQKSSLRDKAGLVLVTGIRPMREHVISYKDECNLSSLRERGILDISRAKVFL